jgi:hypothetical protein
MGRISQITPENINSEATKSCNDLNRYFKKTVEKIKTSVSWTTSRSMISSPMQASLAIWTYLRRLVAKLLKDKTLMRMSCVMRC